MQLTLKWKVYRIANYFVLLSFLFFLGLILFFALKNGIVKSDLVTFLPVVTGMIVVILATFFNLYVLYNYFPDKLLSGILNKLHSLLIILFLLSLLGLLFLCTWGLIEEIKDNTDDNTGVIILSVLFILLLIGFYVLSMQFFVRKFLKTNYRNKMNSLIENIGNQ